MKRLRKEVFLFVLIIFISIEPICAKTLMSDQYLATDAVDYNWIDISKTGKEILADSCYYDFNCPLEIDFTFYSQKVERICISPRGVISFGESPTIFNYRLPRVYKDYDYWLIAPYWDVLSTRDIFSNEPSNSVYYQVLGDKPERKLVVQWQDVSYHFEDEPGAISFEVVLYEGSNKIKFQYKDVEFENDGSSSNGKTATVGIQGPRGAGVESLQWSYERPVLRNEYSIMFMPKK